MTQKEMTQEEIEKKLVKEHLFSKDQIDMGIRAGFKCEYCGRDLLASVDDYKAWQTDHIYPKSKGGGDEQVNKAICCKTCNFIKGSWIPERDGVPFTEPTSDEEREQMITEERKFIAESRVAKQIEVAEIRELAHKLMKSTGG